jgi:hypothetical protein
MRFAQAADVEPSCATSFSAAGGVGLPPAPLAKPKYQPHHPSYKDEATLGILKTNGFNLEDMHLTSTDNLFTLLAGLGLAVALSVKPGAAAAYPHHRTWPRGVAAVCPRPIRLAENLRRRKSSSSKHFPQPTPVPQNSHPTH